MQSRQTTARPKIAVVAVHGVADQAPNETARAVARLLSKRNADQRGERYTTWEERVVEVQNRPVVVSEPDRPIVVDRAAIAVTRRGLPGAFEQGLNERSEYVRAHHQSQTACQPATNPPDYGVMREQLRGYTGEGPGATYRSIRLIGARLADDGTPERDVHIYELYWADLSRLGTAVLQILYQMYQLLFHLGSLGRLTVDLARLEPGNERSRLWRMLSRVEAGAVRILTIPLPVLNLFALAVLLMAIPIALPARIQPLVALGAPGCGLAFLLSYGVFRLGAFRVSARVRSWLWSLPLIVWLVLLSWLGYAFGQDAWPPWPYVKVLGIAWCLLAALVLHWTMARYERLRPKAWSVAAALGGPVLVLLLGLIWVAENTFEGVMAAGLTALALLYLALYAWWTLFWILHVATLVLGWLIVRETRGAHGPHQDQAAFADRTSRAVFTAVLSQTLPATALLVVSLVSLLAVVQLVDPLLTTLPDRAGSLRYASSLVRVVISPATNAGWAPVLAALLVSLASATIVGMYGLAPVVFAEVRPPRKDDQESRASKRLGEWLTHSYRALRVGAYLLIVGTTVILPLGILAALIFPGQTRFQWQAITQAVNGLLALSTAGFVLSGLQISALQHQWERLRNLSLGFRPVFDVMLDVDNYLRGHPYDRNPRARICARYASLLRHLAQWNDPQDPRPYDAIVIVSHSQGTVITADLLRFLRREPDPIFGRPGAPNAIPIYLLTVGCPLRQLYGHSFPHLYQWARHTDVQAWEDGNPAYIPDTQLPDPTALGVRLWMNAFRSGDYVGRYLWRADICRYQWSHPAADEDPDKSWGRSLESLVTITRDEAGLRQEFCIGPGAHTHYFDETAPEIAAAIDKLVHCSNGAPAGSVLQPTPEGREQCV